MRTILTRTKTPLALLALVALALTAAACGGDEGDEAGRAPEPEVTVVASTTHVADLAANVGGERAEVVGLIAANADPHDHEPRPSDVQAVAESDLVLQSGGHLDLWMESIVESSGTDAPAIKLLDSAATIEGGAHLHQNDDQGHEEDDHGGDDHGHEDDDEAADDHGDDEVDPHWWQSPANAALAAEDIRDRLIDIDPEGREAYEANADAYLAELDQLDSAIAECMESIPAGQRKLVTSHDAFGYFADRYDIDVVGAAIPALTTQAQPSGGETAELIDLIREEDVPAVFPEAGIGERLQDALAGETDAEVGGVLWGDTLGPEGSGAETYIEAMTTNARTLATGFSGGSETCAGLAGAEG